MIVAPAASPPHRFKRPQDGALRALWIIVEEKTLYTIRFLLDAPAPVMDKFWCFLTMPIGVALCFGPAMLVWWLTKDKDSTKDESQDGR